MILNNGLSLHGTLLLYTIASQLCWYVSRYWLLAGIPQSCSFIKETMLRSIGCFLFLLFALHCPDHYRMPYLIFVCSSVLVFYTDALAMLIARLTTIWLVPIALACAYHNVLYISWQDSLLGSLLGAGILFLVQRISKAYYGQPGLGTGDIEYMALAGAYTGPLGAWLTLLLGCLLASLWTLGMILRSQLTRTTPFPFGSFLAFAGIIVLLYKYEVAYFLM